MWYRGYSDGDGCFYINKYARQYSISAPFEQDLSFVGDKFTELGIDRFELKKRTHKSKDGKISNSSNIRMSNKKNIKLFGEYIYQDRLDIKFDRKYDKYKEIIIC